MTGSQRPRKKPKLKHSKVQEDKPRKIKKLPPELMYQIFAWSLYMAAKESNPDLIEEVAGEDRVRIYHKEKGFSVFNHPIARTDGLSHQFIAGILVHFVWVFETSRAFLRFVNTASHFSLPSQQEKLSFKMELAIFGGKALSLREPWRLEPRDMPHGWKENMTSDLLVWMDTVEKLRKISFNLQIKMVLCQPYRDFGMLRVATKTLRQANVTLELGFIYGNWEKSPDARLFKAMAAFAVTGMQMDDVHEDRRKGMLDFELKFLMNRGCTGIRLLSILIPKPEDPEAERVPE
ncbi:hypothetical protein ACHAQI_000167 [Fusarium lateritium]